MLTQSLINIFSKEMIGTIIAALPIIKAILNYLNKPLDDIDDIYKKAKLSTWRIRFFMIKISTKEIPRLTRANVILFSVVLLFLLASFATSSYYGVKLLQIRPGWTSLILKETDKWFLISETEASEHAFHPSWHLTEKSCISGEATQLANDKIITPQLGKFICESFTNTDDKNKIKKSIKDTTHNKPIITFLISIITVGCIWFIISLILTLIYTLRLKKFIIREHEKAYDYLT